LLKRSRSKRKTVSTQFKNFKDRTMKYITFPLSIEDGQVIDSNGKTLTTLNENLAPWVQLLLNAEEIQELITLIPTVA